MAGYGTKKQNADYGLQLTFPRTFSEAYDKLKIKPRFAPSGITGGHFDFVGNDFQAQWHNQKRLDAHRMSHAKVESTKNMNQRAELAKGGYYELPKPVLGQRMVAAPAPDIQSYGNNVYGERNNELRGSSGYEGGVLRSKTGQEYAKRILNRRKEWYERMTELPPGEFDGVPAESDKNVVAMPDELPQPMKIEFFILADALLASVQDGRVDRVDVSDVVKLMNLLFKYVPTISDEQEWNDVYAKVEAVAQNIKGLEIADASGRGEEEEGNLMKFVFVVKNVMNNLLDYLDDMAGVFNLQPRDRITASKSFIQKGNYSKKINLAGLEQRDIHRDADKIEGLPTLGIRGKGKHNREEVVKKVMTKGRQAQLQKDLVSKGRFLDKPLPREVEERVEQGDRNPLGDGRDQLDIDDRQNFGYNSGAFFGDSAQMEGSAMPRDRLKLLKKR